VGSRITLKSWRSAERLEFSVEDNGPGIDALDMPLIFEKFYRGKKSQHKTKGSGMGLAITRAILIAHGGGIDAASAPGKGASFHFWVPLVEKEPVKEQANVGSKAQARTERVPARRELRKSAKTDEQLRGEAAQP
jgi:signal transduction histidine kinase